MSHLKVDMLMDLQFLCIYLTYCPIGLRESYISNYALPHIRR